MRSPILDIEHKSFFRNSETPIEEVPLLSPCATITPSCYLKIQATLPLGTPNFYHTSMVTPEETSMLALEATPKT